MAFLRAYMMGDPGLGSFFKKLKKKISLKNIAKVVMPVASVANSSFGRRIGAGFIPGGAGVAANALISSGMGSSIGSPGTLPPTVYGGDWKSALGSLGREAASRLLEQYTSGGAGPGMNVGPDFSRVKSGSSTTAPLGRKLTNAERAAMGMRRAPRMRATNVAALRRSIRRVKSFARIARQTIVLDKRVKLRKRGKR